MYKKIISELKSNLEFMSRTEAKIAKVILADGKMFAKYSLTHAAKVCGVSQGSIINFSKKYVGGGFPTLKLAVASSVFEKEQPFTVLEKKDSLKQVLDKTVKNIGFALQNTITLNNEEILRTVAEKILSAKKVEIYGVFRSAVVATDFYYQLLQLGIPANFVSDVLTCAVSASLLKEGSLVIAVSSSGQTQDIIDAVRLAKANGVPVACITAHKNSPLAKLSDYVLIAAMGGNSVSSAQTEIRMAQLVIADAICSYLRTKIDDENHDKYFKMREILNSHNVKD